MAFHYIRPNLVSEIPYDVQYLVTPNALDLNDALVKFSELSSLSKEDYEERERICTLIRNSLRKFYPECLVLPYGSTANGLGFKGCDLDMLFLPWPSYCNVDVGNSESKWVKFWDVEKGIVPKEVLLHMDEVSQLHFVKQALCSISEIKKVIYIPASHPIINFTSTVCNIVCDLSASNRLVHYNSMLINHLIKIDWRVKPLVMSLRWWGKKLKFILKGRFSSYSFTLLVIFYLQTTKPPILPPIKMLMDVSGTSRVIAGWECSFSEDLSVIPRSENEESLGLLLLNFFKFCWDFDFIRHVICLQSSSALAIADLLNSPDERLSEFKISSVCIQDIFVLSHNVASNVNSKVSHSFKLSVYKAYSILSHDSTSIQYEKIFNIVTYGENPDPAYEKKSITVISLTYELVKNLGIDARLELVWFHKASWAIFETLQHALLIECEVIDMSREMPNFSHDVPQPLNTSPGKSNGIPCLNKHNSKALDGSNFHADLEVIMCIQCLAFHRTYVGRKAAQKVFETENSDCTDLDVLQFEHSLSEFIIGKDPLLNSTEPFLLFYCDIYKYKFNQLYDIVVEFTPLKRCKESTGVFMFLKSFVPKTVMNHITNKKYSVEH